MARQGDVVMFRHKNAWHHGLIVRWNGNPDAHALLMDQEANTYRVYVHECIEATQDSQGRPVFPNGEYAWSISTSIAEVKDSQKGRRSLERSRGRTYASVSSRGITQKPEHIMPSQSAGSPVPCQEPLKMCVGFSSELTPLMVRRLDGAGESAKLMHALRAVNPRYADVIFYNLERGEPLVEVAKRLGVTPGNARVLKHRALEALRALQHETLPAWDHRVESTPLDAGSAA